MMNYKNNFYQALKKMMVIGADGGEGTRDYFEKHQVESFAESAQEISKLKVDFYKQADGSFKLEILPILENNRFWGDGLTTSKGDWKVDEGSLVGRIFSGEAYIVREILIPISPSHDESYLLESIQGDEIFSIGKEDFINQFTRLERV